MSRRDGSIDPHLDLKIGLFFLAAALGVAGMIFGQPMMIFAAMVVIGVGLLLRFFGKRQAPPGRGAGRRGDEAGERERGGGGDTVGGSEQGGHAEGAGGDSGGHAEGAVGDSGSLDTGGGGDPGGGTDGAGERDAAEQEPPG